MEEQDGFFEKQTPASFTKSELVFKYFDAWSIIMKTLTERFIYIDLFSGQGTYKDGSDSTPIKIVKKVLLNEEISKKAIFIFNDSNIRYINNLRDSINKLEVQYNKKLTTKYYNKNVDEFFTNIFSTLRLYPTLLFVDPFGYKGLTLELLKSVLKDFGCDIIFFFNYNRIANGIHNPKIEVLLKMLFNENNFEKLRRNTSLGKDKELFILETLKDSLKQIGGNYFVPVRFMFPKKNQVSHYIIFTSKAKKGQEIFKSICQSNKLLPIPDYSCFQFEQKKFNKDYIYDAYYESNIKRLAKILYSEFRQQSKSVKDLILGATEHSHFTERDVKQALFYLESERKIQVNSTNGKPRRANTMAEHLEVKFI